MTRSSLIPLQISKKLVNSDYKNQRVEDPTHITSRKEKQVKQHVKEYFDKAAAKRRDHERKKAEQKEKNVGGAAEATQKAVDSIVQKEEESDDEPGVNLSDDEMEKDKQDSDTPITPQDQFMHGDGLKRKREDRGDTAGMEVEDENATPSKRLRSETPPPPPPPPPPPANGDSLAERTPSDLPMADVVAGIEYPNSDVGYQAQMPEVMGEGPLVRESPTMEIDPAPPPPVFSLVGPFSNPAENSDQTRSPSVCEASDMTPIESDGERDQPNGSYAGMDLERVQRLQVHHGS